MMEFTQGMAAGGRMGEAHKHSSPVVLLLLKALLMAKLSWRTCSLACLHYPDLQGSPQAGQSWGSASSLGASRSGCPSTSGIGKTKLRGWNGGRAEHRCRTLHLGCLPGVSLLWARISLSKDHSVQPTISLPFLMKE